MSHPVFVSRSVLVLASCLAVGCVAEEPLSNPPAPFDDGDRAAEHPPGPLHPDTFLVEDHDCFVGATTSDANAVIEFEFSCAATDVEGLEVGRIVMGADDGGYLRRVDLLAFDGTHATAWTSSATLAEAMTDVRIDETIALDDGARDMLDFSGREVLPTSDDGPGYILVERGSLDIRPVMDLDVDIGFLRLKAATATLTLGISFEVQALMEATAALSHSDTIPLGTHEYPFEIDVGPTTVSGKVDFVMHLHVEHEADGPASDRFGFAGGGQVVLGGTWEADGDTWTRTWQPTFQGTVSDQVASGSGHSGRVSVSIEAVMSMDKVDGSTFRYEPWTTGDVGVDCDGLTLESAGGISGETTMHLGFFDDGPRVERYPDLNIEADRAEGYSHHDVPPADCGEPPADPVDTCNPVGRVKCSEPFDGDTSNDPFATSALNGYSVAVGNYNAPELAWTFVAPYSGPVEVALVDPVPTEVNHDLFILDGGAGVCTAGEAIAFGFNSVEFEAQEGHTYYFVVDGFDQDAGAFEAVVNCD